MLRIRREQLGAFTWTAKDSYAHQILTFVAEHYPEALRDLSEAEALGRILWGLQVARGLGVTDDRAAALFVVTQFGVGPDFHHHPDCARLLNQRRLHPNDRVHTLFLPSEQIDWAGVASSCDPGAWPRVDREGPAL